VTSESAQAEPTIALMPGLEALPRRSGELVFHADWERRAFALAVTLSERGLFGWDEFRERLVARIAAADATAAAHDAPGYYEHWLAALELTLEKKRLLQMR
jgi:nitrile hydratase accessory protein